MKKLLVLLLTLSFWQGCYSFKGVTIDPNAKTFSVALFSNNAPAAPPTLAQEFTEKLKDEIRNNTRLSLVTEGEADLMFSGNISGFDVTAIAPQPNQNATFNQLKVSITVDLIDNKNEKNSWKQTFVSQLPFDGNKQLLDVQDALLKDMKRLIATDVFNKAFTENW